MSEVPVIAIDGPSGSGKGTAATRVAAALGWHLLDSGALYRIVGVIADRRGVSVDDESALVALAEALDIRFDAHHVWVDGDDLGQAIRTEDAGELASKVARHGALRDAILALQRSFQKAPGLVADGRDMGTVVFTAAPLKIFLEASAEVRAERRYNQLKNKGLSVSLRGLLAQIRERDERDRGRAVAPLKPAEDALIIDSTSLSIDEVVAQIMTLARQRELDRR